ncbi:MAG: purine-binding chemotaxis protein CheW [Acidobacteria bacterium]|nr:purine-binding chemotaxis protein CheW [Acidobacteriota bacterium]
MTGAAGRGFAHFPETLGVEVPELNTMDGNNLTTPPAGFASWGMQPQLPNALGELPASQEAASLTSLAVTAMAPSAPVAPSSTPGQPGISARDLLDELRTGQLAAERAFLERARGLRTETERPESAPPQLLSVREKITPTPVAVAAAPVAAAPEPTLGPALGMDKQLIFALGELRYAVPLDHIIEIAELENLTPVPNVPDWILGITNLRGDILSLVDLNALFGEPSAEVPRGSSLLVAQTNAGDLTTCLVVDRVYGVVNVAPEQMQKLDQVANHALAQHTRGYVSHADGLLSLLDLEGLLRALELRD